MFDHREKQETFLGVLEEFRDSDWRFR